MSSWMADWAAETQEAKAQEVPNQIADGNALGGILAFHHSASPDSAKCNV
jgi:hypothetical protein